MIQAGLAQNWRGLGCDKCVPRLNTPCLPTQRRCLHGALLEALQQEAKAQEGSAAAAQPDAAAAGQDVEMPDAGAQGAPGGGAAGAAAGAAGGGAGCRRPRVTVSSLSPAQQDRVVEQMVQGADIQLGLVNACIEVGAACVGGGQQLVKGTAQLLYCLAAAVPASASHLGGGGPEHLLKLGSPLLPAGRFLHRWSTTRTCAPASTPSRGPRCSWAGCTTRWSCGRWVQVVGGRVAVSKRMYCCAPLLKGRVLRSRQQLPTN